MMHTGLRSISSVLCACMFILLAGCCLVQVSMIQTLCYLLEALLTAENTPPDTHKDIYELYFVFAAIWSFGGFLFKDEVRRFSVHAIGLCLNEYPYSHIV